MTEKDTINKVIGALESCKFGTDPCVHNECPYFLLADYGMCIHDLHKEASRLISSLVAFKEYFSDLYGTGLKVAGWHLNGALEPFDSFYESAENEER